MKLQDYTDAAGFLLARYLDDLGTEININNTVTKSFGLIDIGMGGEWNIRTTDGLSALYATPFYEMGKGLPVLLETQEGDTIKEATLPFEITGDLKKDAELYIVTLNVFLSLVDV